MPARSGSVAAARRRSPGVAVDSAADPYLFFAKSRAVSPRKMFPHFFGPILRSKDNGLPRFFSGGHGDYYDREFLRPSGEGGQHAAYGGYFRDRPLPRRPIAGDYVYEDLRWEIQTAQGMGADGFFVNLMGYAGWDWQTYRRMVDAAVQLGTGFKVVPMIDTVGGDGAMGRMSADEVAAGLGYFIGKSSTYLEDGKFFLSSFAGEVFSNQRWAEIKAAISARYGLQVSLCCALLNNNQQNILRVAPVCSSVGGWMIGADPATLTDSGTQAALAPRIARGAGRGWMGTAHTQINVPYTGHYFDEACNSAALRESWHKIIRDESDYVQNVTWCDFSEGGQIEPSVAKGWCQYAITAYYAQKWKHGEFPTITRDVVFLSHRDQPTGLPGSAFRSGQTAVMTQSVSRFSSPLQDKIEVLSYLTSPAEITVRVNGVAQPPYLAPAGEYVRTYPNALTTGSNRHSVSFARDGRTLGSVTSPFTVSATPISQDRQYFFVSTLHGTEQQYHPVMSE